MLQEYWNNVLIMIIRSSHIWPSWWCLPWRLAPWRIAFINGIFVAVMSTTAHVHMSIPGPWHDCNATVFLQCHSRCIFIYHHVYLCSPFLLCYGSKQPTRLGTISCTCCPLANGQHVQLQGSSVLHIQHVDTNYYKLTLLQYTLPCWNYMTTHTHTHTNI